MKIIEPKGLGRILAGAACDCICSFGSAIAKQAGQNGGVCGCYCGHNNNVANFSKADNTCAIE